MNRFIPRAAAALVAAVAVLALAPAASAHVTPVQPTAPAGDYATVELQVPHGCDGQPTNVVSVQLRDDITSVSAEAVPGWEVSVDRQPLDEPVEVHGQAIEDYVASVTWTATGDPLPEGQYLRFGISMKTPDLAGETILLPTVQRCIDGSESPWLDADPASDAPAPSIELVAAEGGHGGEVEPVSTESPDDDEEVAAASSTDGDDAGTDTLARVLSVIAILVGLGGGALALRRRS